MTTPGSISVEDILNVLSPNKPIKRVEPCRNSAWARRVTDSDLTKALEKPRKEFACGTDYVKQYKDEEKKNLLQKNREPVMAPGRRLMEHNELELTSTITTEIPSTNDILSEETSHVYANYVKGNHTYDKELPITSHRDEILQMVDTYQVVIIQGNTGCGKTTQVPQYILDHNAARNKHCNIVVTQPRRIAAISVARRVCHERRWPLKTVVGYHVGLDNHTSPDTRITYMTTGVLLEKLIGKKNMNDFTHVIIDEVHERDIETDFVLLVVKKFLNTVSRGVKVILMSATFDASLFAKYFPILIQNRLENSPIVEIYGKMKPVTEFYINDLIGLRLPIPDFSISEPCIPQGSFELAHELIKGFDSLEEKENVTGRTSYPRGSVLVFLPGYNEISSLRDVLHDDATTRKWTVLPLHSTVTLEEQGNAFIPPRDGYRKIILSTNIAESSITVPDIRYVIDFCLTKSLICDSETNYSRLQAEWASKANCKQRAGRAGRVTEGRVYRMVPSSFYRQLPEFGVPEMKRCPLEIVVLKMKKLDLGEPKSIFGISLDPPDLGDIERAVLTLKEVSALATTVNGRYSAFDGDLTFVGTVMAQLPLDVRVSKLVILGFVFDCLEECIIIAACLSVRSIFSKPFQQLLESYKARVSWADGTFSDCLAYYKAYTTWEDLVNQDYFKQRNSEIAWCRINFMQIKRIREVSTLVKELRDRLCHFGLRTYHTPDRTPQQTENHCLILKIVIAGAFYPNYFVQDTLVEHEVLKSLSNKDPLTTVSVQNLPQNQGILYASSLYRIFQACSEKMKIDFEESKAFIQFERKKSDKTTGILPALYVAVKMRHLRTPMVLHLYRPDEAKRKLSQLEKLRTEIQDKSNCLRTNRIRVVPNQDPLKQVPLPKPDQLTISIVITEVVTCGHFWAQYSDPKCQMTVNFLKDTVNCGGGANLKPVEEELKPGMLILAPYQGLYFRARVEDVGKEIEVFFVDYGNTDKMDVSLLREINPETHLDALTTPAQAFECVLSEIKPSSALSSKGDWTKEAICYFSKIAGERKQFLAQIYSVVDDVVHLNLICQSLTGLQYSVNDLLKEASFAEHAEESYASKMDHTRRENYSATKEFLETPHFKVDEVDLSRLDDFDSSALKSTRKQRLFGPFSPLEVGFSGITALSSSRSCRIEADSVNSIVFDPEPQNPHKRFLVACHVGLNPNGDTIAARTTTLMPNIPGLLSLVSLIFTPFAELRVNKDKTKFTGALCGLGYNKETGESLYPDHDVELSFDIEINNIDIKNINLARMCINWTLGENEDLVTLQPMAIIQRQKKARDYLMEVIKSNKTTIEPQMFPRRYHWNQFPDDLDRIVTFLKGTAVDCAYVLPLHETLVLRSSLLIIKQLLEDLHIKASRSTEPQITNCPLCKVVCSTPRELYIHLQSEEHVRQESQLFDALAAEKSDDANEYCM